MTTPEREKFEKWADTHKSGVAYTLKSNESYYQVWQAALSAAPTPPEMHALKDEIALCHGTLESRDRNIEALKAEIGRLKSTPPEADPVRYEFRDKHGVNMSYPGPWIECPKESFDRKEKTIGLEYRIIRTSPPSPKADEIELLEAEVQQLMKTRDIYLYCGASHARQRDILQSEVRRLTAETKAEYDAEGNPLNLMAAAQNAVQLIEGIRNICTYNGDYADIRRVILEMLEHTQEDPSDDHNLRKFIGES